MIQFSFTCDRSRELYVQAGLYNHENGVMSPATKGSAAIDLVCCHTAAFVLRDRRTHKIQLGIRVAIPHGHVGILAMRSSTWGRYGVMIPNGIGIIDSDYRGEICGLIYHPAPSYDDMPSTITPGDSLFQLLVVPIVSFASFENVESLSTTQRGDGGFGSTDRWRDGKERM